jgi:hypothetical protein
MAISNVRWGAASSAANTTGALFALTPAFPTASAPVEGDLLVVVARSWRNAKTTFPSTPQLDVVAFPGWVTEYNVGIGNPTTSPTGTLSTNSMRHRIWFNYYSAGMTAPDVTYSATTVSDYMTVQMACMTGADASMQAPFDQIGTWTAAAATSTTVIGPAPVLPAPVVAGSAVIVLLDHENKLTSGSVPNVSGDGLTWTQGAQGGTTAAFGWANYSALVPTQTSVTAKQATIATTSGRGSGHMMSFVPAVPIREFYNVNASVGRASVR